MSTTQIANLSTSYFYANVIFLFIAGVLIDYISRRDILIFVCALNVIAIFLFAIAQAPWQIFICHFLAGLAGTFSLTACIRLTTRWFPPKRLATVIGQWVGLALQEVYRAGPFHNWNKPPREACSEPMGMRIAIFSSLISVFCVAGSVFASTIYDGTLLSIAGVIVTVTLFSCLIKLYPATKT